MAAVVVGAPGVNFANYGASAVTSGASGTTAPAAGTSENWTMAAVNGTFPSTKNYATPPQQLSIVDSANLNEIIAVTHISGTNWIVTRGTEGTTPVAHAAGATFVAPATAAGLGQLKDTDWVNAVQAFGADPTGTNDSTTAIQLAMLSWGTASGYAQGAGGVVYLPAGYYIISNTLIIPPGVTLRGAGMFATVIKLSNSVNVDMIQMERYSFTTTTTSGISGVITSIPVNAIPAALTSPASVTVSNGTNLQTFTVTGTVTAGSTSIPVTSATVLFTFNSGSTVYDASQAAVLTATAPTAALVPSNLGNAFLSGVRDIMLHGNAGGTTIPGYHHGINITTYPTLTTAPGDVQFDTSHTYNHVYIQGCTGDGYYHQGRSDTSLVHVKALYNNGNGFTPSFDTSMVGCFSGFNGCAGFYSAHSSMSGASCKSYNNGNGYPWVSGQAYSPGNSVISANILYFCILSVTSATAPAGDSTHWTAMPATSAQAWGCGFYWDANSYEQGWAGCDSQEDSNSSYYFKNCNTIALQGTSYEPNFPNNTNPNNVASVAFDGATGCTANISVSFMTVTQSYALRLINSAALNNIVIASDGTEFGLLSSDSTAIAGSTNNLTYNGQFIFNSVAYLATTFTAANSGAAQNVTGMGLSLLPGTYRFQAYLPVQMSISANTTMNFTFSGTAGTPTIITWAWNIGASAIAPTTSATFTTASSAQNPTASIGSYMEVYGVIKVTATGTVQLQVTNQTAADLTEILAGAWMEFFRMA